jgi:hypothetical protein
MFFFLVFVLAIPFWVIGAMTELQLLPGVPVSALMFVCPVLAALILIQPDRGTAGAKTLLMRSFDHRRIKRKIWYAPILLLYPCVMVLSYGVARLTETPVPVPQLSLPWTLALCASFFISALGEELGWSGYATHPLQVRWGALQAGLILGSVWAMFHYVALLEEHRSVSWIAWWSLHTVAARVIMVWICNNAGKSVFGAALFHATLDVGWQLFPVNGSYWDPRLSGLIMALVATIVTAVWGPRTLTRGRRA